MPILIDELLIEAEPPRAPPPAPGGAQAQRAGAPGQADRMLELSMVADRSRRLEVD